MKRLDDIEDTVFKKDNIAACNTVLDAVPVQHQKNSYAFHYIDKKTAVIFDCRFAIHIMVFHKSITPTMCNNRIIPYNGSFSIEN